MSVLTAPITSSLSWKRAVGRLEEQPIESKKIRNFNDLPAKMRLDPSQKQACAANTALINGLDRELASAPHPCDRICKQSAPSDGHHRRARLPRSARRSLEMQGNVGSIPPRSTEHTWPPSHRIWTLEYGISQRAQCRTRTFRPQFCSLRIRQCVDNPAFQASRPSRGTLDLRHGQRFA